MKIGSTRPATKTTTGTPTGIALLLASAAAALTAYLMDPDQGARRRHMLRDRVAAAIRQGVCRVERGARAVGAEAYGVSRKVTHIRPVAREYDDVTLAHKIESELFRGTSVSAGSVNVNVEDGVVVLRGEIADPEDIEILERKARRIPGVVDVENLLHLPGTPAKTS